MNEYTKYSSHFSRRGGTGINFQLGRVFRGIYVKTEKKGLRLRRAVISAELKSNNQKISCKFCRFKFFVYVSTCVVFRSASKTKGNVADF